MRLAMKPPPREMPENGWSAEQISNARGILLNTPDVPRRKFYLCRAVQIVIFIAFMFGLWLVSLISYWLVVPAWFLGLFFVTGEYLRGFASSRRDLEWARTVLDEAGEHSAPNYARDETA